MAKSKENKRLIELGQKQRAGQLISEYIRGIGDERTERVDVVISPDKCERRLISKAEALARDIWKKALSKEIDADNEVDEKMRLEYRKLIIDRIEGKVGAGSTGGDIEHPSQNVPNRVSEINKSRLNKLAKSGEKKSKKA